MELHTKTSDYYYDLPEELIAQTPIEPRDSSRLLVVGRGDGSLRHSVFRNIVDFLEPGDCLVLNDSRVLPARLYGIREGTGAKVEFLLLHHREKDVWEALAGPGKRAKPGNRFTFGDGVLKGEVLDVLEGGNRLIRFSYEGDFYQILDQIGSMPLPHYITHELKDKERYQNVYSHEVGSAAAPTAGLHFTPQLLEKIREKGVRIAFVTLHVGLGTFRPVKTENITEDVYKRQAFGGATTLPWGMQSSATELVVPNSPVHPCFLYESIWCLLGFLLLHVFTRKYRKYDGQTFLLYLLWYGVGRFFIEGLRQDSLLTPFLGLRVSQVVAAATVLISLVLLLIFSKKTTLTGCGSRRIMLMNSIIDETPAEDDGESTIFGDIDPSELNLNEGDALAEDTDCLLYTSQRDQSGRPLPALLRLW